MEQSQHLLTDADQTIYCLKFLLNTCSAATFCQRKSEEMKEEQQKIQVQASDPPASTLSTTKSAVVSDSIIIPLDPMSGIRLSIY